MENWNFILDCTVALALGIVIGLERQWRQHPAGLRTNALVALGAALFVSVTALVDEQNSKTRVAAYIVSGLGFLGGGVILRDGLNVKGMNTAATLWCSGAVGTLAGSGFPVPAVFGTFLILFVHIALRPVVRWIDAKIRTATDIETYYRIRVTCQHSQVAVVRRVFLRHVGGHERMSIQGLATEENEKDLTVVVADIYAAERNDRVMEDIVARISIEPDVMAVRWERARE
jgi:putative Mg2+ transporter-C (MgtC) family protein